MFKYVLFAALLTFACAKPKPVVIEYPVTYEYAAYSAPVAYTHYDYHDHEVPYAAYSYEYSPYVSHYDYLKR